MRVFAKFPFGYGEKHLDRGELIELRGFPRDNQLLGLRYFIPYNKSEHEDVACSVCGRHFMSHGALTEHRRKPDCFDDSATPTKRDAAELLGVGLDKVVVEDD